MKRTSLLTLAALVAISGLIVVENSEAGPRNRRIARTERHQMHRINQGVRSGQLTREEAKGLREEQKEINQERKAAKRDDGVIDREERKEIRKDQIEASKNIYQEKHDGETRE